MKHIKGYRQLFENTQELTQEQRDWLDQCTYGTWSVNPQTGLVDVDGGLIKGGFNCNDQGLTDFKGVRFGRIYGYFNCAENELRSLEGSPRSVGTTFLCNNNQLTSLEGGPLRVGGSYYCSNNKLTSLEGAPGDINDDFVCYNNQLTSFKGAPESIRDTFDFSNNQVTSIDGIPKRIGFRMISWGNPISEYAFSLILSVKGRAELDESLLEKIVAKIWEKLPDEDKIYLYSYNNDLSQEERDDYRALERYSKRVI